MTQHSPQEGITPKPIHSQFIPDAGCARRDSNTTSSEVEPRKSNESQPGGAPRHIRPSVMPNPAGNDSGISGVEGHRSSSESVLEGECGVKGHRKTRPSFALSSSNDYAIRDSTSPEPDDGRRSNESQSNQATERNQSVLLNTSTNRSQNDDASNPREQERLSLESERLNRASLHAAEQRGSIESAQPSATLPRRRAWRT